MITADSPEPADNLRRARALLWAAFGLTIFPAVLMTADHLARQKPAAQRQAAVFAAIGLSTPSFFPAGHPARMAASRSEIIDWRPTPALPMSPPGPTDLLRPAAARPGVPARGR